MDSDNPAAAAPEPIALNTALVESNALVDLDRDPASELAVPANDPIVLVAPDIALVAPDSAFDMPVTEPDIPFIAPAALPNEDVISDTALAVLASEDNTLPVCCIADIVGPKPTVVAAVTIPVTCAAASDPVIAPTFPNAVCACCIVFTTDLAWAVVF
jgi:hypothetical protein